MKIWLLKNKLVAAAICLALLTGVGGYFYAVSFSAAKTSAEKSSPPAETVQRVIALGRLEPESKVIKLTAAPQEQQGAARLARLFVKEGDAVTENQIVAELDGKDRARAAVAEAAENVRVAEAHLAQVRAGAKTGDIEAQRTVVSRTQADLDKAHVELRRAETPNAAGVVPAPEVVAVERLEADLENADLELARAEKLFASGDVSKSSLDARRTTVKTLNKEIERARAALQTAVIERRNTVKTLEQERARGNYELQSVAEIRPTDVQAAQAEVERQRAALEKARVNLNDLDVKALTGGTVLKINTRAGEAVSGDGIIEIGATDQMFVVAEVFEEDIAKVKIGQTAEMKVRSTGEVLRGTVAEIGYKIGKRSLLDTDPVADVDARVVETRIKLDTADSRRVAGLTNLRVDVTINFL